MNFFTGICQGFYPDLGPPHAPPCIDYSPSPIKFWGTPPCCQYLWETQIKGYEMFVFWKIWQALFSCYPVLTFALLPYYQQYCHFCSGHLQFYSSQIQPHSLLFLEIAILKMSKKLLESIRYGAQFLVKAQVFTLKVY